MPRTNQQARSLTRIYEEAKICGETNILCNDAESGKVLAGSDYNTLEGSTIANKRSRGELDIPAFKAGRETRYRLSDLLSYRDKRFRSCA